MFPSYFGPDYFPSAYYPIGFSAAPMWPSGLPQRPLQRGYSEKRSPLIVRTPMDLGPAKVRLRQTTSATEFTMIFSLQAAQVAMLMEFWDVTCHGGALQFEWEHPRTGVDGQFRFIEPPTIAPAQNRVAYDVGITVEMLP